MLVVGSKVPFIRELDHMSSQVGPNELSYNRYARKSGRERCIYADDSRSFRGDV